MCSQEEEKKDEPNFLFNMLPKKNRVDKKSVDKIFKIGRFVNSPSLTFKFLITNNNKKKISFITPKNVARLAVRRNLLRRRGYSALEKYLKRFPTGLLGVFIFKRPLDSVLEIENEIKKILDKIN
jgi:ribonuclease P protein component